MRRTFHALMPWLFVACALWLGQLWYIGSTTSGPFSYWAWRGWYRPGIQVVEHQGGEYLPDHTFHPLSPSGAKLAFVLSAGVYALVGTLLIWMAWRGTRTRRRRVVSKLTRPAPRRGVRRRAA